MSMIGISAEHTWCFGTQYMVTYFFSNCQTAHAFLTCGVCEFSLPVQLFQLSCCMLGCALHICQHLPDKSIHVEYTKMALGCCRRVAVSNTHVKTW